MLSYTFPLSEANKEAFWQEKGMQVPQYASPVANNHSSSCNPKPWREPAQALCCHWCIHRSRLIRLCPWCLSSEGPPHSFGSESSSARSAPPQTFQFIQRMMRKTMSTPGNLHPTMRAEAHADVSPLNILRRGKQKHLGCRQRGAEATGLSPTWLKSSGFAEET